MNLFFSPSLNKKSKDNECVSILENYYKLKINKVYLPKKEALILKYLHKITWFNDYPLTSISSVNQYLMGVEAKKQNIKILISGQGADELFYGYLKYYSFYMISLIKNKNILIFFRNLFNLVKNNFLSQINFYRVFRYLSFNFLNQSKFFDKNFLKVPKDYKNFKNLKKRSFYDMNRFSVPTLCHVEDRMYMLSGVETRFPYLNNDLQKFSLSLPDSFKLSFGYTKYILRKAFVNQLPNRILYRKDKEGFETGLSSFLENNQIILKKKFLNEKSLILKEKIVSEKFLKYFDNYLNASLFKDIYDPHLIFRIISFEIWLHTFKKYLNLKK